MSQKGLEYDIRSADGLTVVGFEANGLSAFGL